MLAFFTPVLSSKHAQNLWGTGASRGSRKGGSGLHFWGLPWLAGQCWIKTIRPLKTTSFIEEHPFQNPRHLLASFSIGNDPLQCVWKALELAEGRGTSWHVGMRLVGIPSLYPRLRQEWPTRRRKRRCWSPKRRPAWHLAMGVSNLGQAEEGELAIQLSQMNVYMKIIDNPQSTNCLLLVPFGIEKSLPGEPLACRILGVPDSANVDVWDFRMEKKWKDGECVTQRGGVSLQAEFKCKGQFTQWSLFWYSWSLFKESLSFVSPPISLSAKTGRQILQQLYPLVIEKPLRGSQQLLLFWHQVPALISSLPFSDHQDIVSQVFSQICFGL